MVRIISNETLVIIRRRTIKLTILVITIVVMVIII
jgi:hypothetical protein